MSTPFKSDLLSHATVLGNIVTGQAKLPETAHILEATFTVEEEEPSVAAFTALIENSHAIINQLNPEKLTSLKQAIAQEITDSAYSQHDYEPTVEDYVKLTNDLKLLQANFYEDDALLVFTSETIFQDQQIYVQINEDLSIEDLSIGE